MGILSVMALVKSQKSNSGEHARIIMLYVHFLACYINTFSQLLIAFESL
jgi:hypothetical protein